MSEEHQKKDGGVVDLEHARARLRSRSGKASPESLAGDLKKIRGLIDQGLSGEARTQLNSLLANARSHPAILAEARCLLSIALEMQGQYHESLDAVAMYELPDTRAKFDPDLNIRLRVQIAIAYNYNGDHPKAITLLKSALPELPEDGAQVGLVYAALARVYRSISEYPIARDYSRRALDCYRQTGDWRGMAEAYFGLGTADVHEGHHEASLENYEQAIQ